MSAIDANVNQYVMSEGTLVNKGQLPEAYYHTIISGVGYVDTGSAIQMQGQMNAVVTSETEEAYEALQEALKDDKRRKALFDEYRKSGFNIPENNLGVHITQIPGALFYKKKYSQ